MGSVEWEHCLSAGCFNTCVGAFPLSCAFWMAGVLFPSDNTCNLTVTEGFQLNTERRAKERLEFDQAICEKEALRARMEEERRKAEEERERDEIAHLRQEQVSS